MDCNRARTKDPGEWLQTCPDFSQPLAEQVVEWFLNWQPDLTESIKWNMLCFSGRKLVCGLSACQRHLGVTFFRGTELPDPTGLFIGAGEGNTNIRSVRLTSLTTLYLNYNGIGAEGCEALAPALQGLSLTTLDLRGNDIGAEGCKALQCLTSLTKVYIQ